MQALPPKTTENTLVSSLGSLPNPTEKDQANGKLANARLGSFSGLFHALRAKHPPTAAHCLRVSLACSRWAEKLGMGEVDRDRLEIAALLHDIGKIGIPDAILQKPSQLTIDEQLQMQMHTEFAEEILLGCGAHQEIIDMVRYARHSGNGEAVAGSRTAGMLAIVDAYDSMTTEQVFRRALSRETAINELFASAHISNELVSEYCDLISRAQPELDGAVAHRWLKQLAPEDVPGFTADELSVVSTVQRNINDTVFQPRLMETMSDAAIFLDSNMQILQWNRAAEQITGRRAASVMNCQWDHSVVGLSSESEGPLDAKDCPFSRMKQTHTISSSRLMLTHSNGKSIAVSVTAVPVFTRKGAYGGAILLIRDASTEANLEQRVESLHKIATSDALTHAANRVELDRRLPEIINEHQDGGEPASVMICDIDFFKKINDTFGHQAGDDALVTFAGILKEQARSSDIVARFGGEEFVVVCPDCDIATATDRAEEIRRAIERTPVPSLDNRTMTASFGVTELLNGDTPELWLARADRALLEAKETGRNRVVQVGTGIHDASVLSQGKPDDEGETNYTDASTDDSDDAMQLGSWFSWFNKSEQKRLRSTELLSSVPSDLTVQKLAGFVHDYAAEIVQADEHIVAIKVDMSNTKFGQRAGERPAILLLQIEVIPVEYRNAKGSAYQSRTKLNVEVHMLRARDRRREALQAQAGQLLASFQSYLVTQIIDQELAMNINEPR